MDPGELAEIIRDTVASVPLAIERQAANGFGSSPSA